MRPTPSSIPTFILQPRETRSIFYRFRSRNPKIHYVVESSRRTKVFLVDDIGLSDFRNGRNFEYFNENYLGTHHEERIRLPHGDNWCFLIYNTTDYRASVYYKVYE